MTYVYNGRVYEVDYVRRNLDDEEEIFLIDNETRDAISVYDLPSDIADDLWSACEDLIRSDYGDKVDHAYELGRDQDFDWGFGDE